MLTVSKLKRAYGDFIAADAVDFSIAKVKLSVCLAITVQAKPR